MTELPQSWRPGLHRTPTLLAIALLSSAIISTDPAGSGSALAAEAARPAVRPRTRTDRPFLGVTTEPVDAETPGGGLRIIHMYDESAARTMGLRVGDEIIALNDVIIPDRKVFVRELAAEKPGATIRFLLRRDGQKIRLKGKIGGYRETMTRIQAKIRRRLIGHPLPDLPPTRWWNPETKTFAASEGPSPVEAARGRVVTLFCIDDCKTCVDRRYALFKSFQQRVDSVAQQVPFTTIGIYQSDAQDSEAKGAAARHARALCESKPPSFPMGLVTFEDDPLPPEKREERLYLHNHGVVILDTEGKVRYVQVLGLPAAEYQSSLQAVLLEAMQKLKEAATTGEGGSAAEGDGSGASSDGASSDGAN